VRTCFIDAECAVLFCTRVLLAEDSSSLAAVQSVLSPALCRVLQPAAVNGRVAVIVTTDADTGCKSFLPTQMLSVTTKQ